MSTTRKLLLALAGFALFMVLAVGAYSSLTSLYPRATTPSNTAAGGALATSKPRTAPDFTVIDANGKAVRLVEFAGKPVVLNFWASWCGPCKSEMPLFNTIYQEMKNDVSFIMLDLVDGQCETVETGAAFIRQQGFAFPVYFDTKQQAANKYGITAIPTTFFIDAKGDIRYSYRGAIEERTLRAGIALIRK